MDDPVAHVDILSLSVEQEATLGHARLPQDTSISIYGLPGRHEGYGRFSAGDTRHPSGAIHIWRVFSWIICVPIHHAPTSGWSRP